MIGGSDTSLASTTVLPPTPKQTNSQESMSQSNVEHGQGRHSSRGRHQNKRAHNDNQGHVPMKNLAFKGNTPGMNGHVFQCFYEHQDSSQYSNMIEALVQYIDKTLDYPEDIKCIAQLQEPMLVEPMDLPDTKTSKVKITVWNQKVVCYCK